MSNKKTKLSKKWILIIFLAVLTGFLIWGVSWATYARPPLPEAAAAMTSSEQVLVNTEPWLSFIPQDKNISTGLIFYPGGRIDPRGYASLMHSIAAEGYLVIVPSMPINMAIFDTNAAEEIITHFSEIENWVIAGHSVGGTSAAIFTAKNPGKIDGLAIWASYPANSNDLSGMDLPVYMIYGELDDGVDKPMIEEKKRLLPADTVYLEIPGGDHHQFGSYLTKPGEDQSSILRAVQHDLIIQGMLELLDLVLQKNP